MKIPYIILICTLFIHASSLWAQDCWLSVSGGGKKDGTSEENAYAAQGNGSRFAQKCWDQTANNGTMYVLPGTYSVENKAFWRLKITGQNDGDEVIGQNKHLAGIGHVSLHGPRPPYSSETRSHGGTWITIGRGASHITISNFAVHNVEHGIRAVEGGNRKLLFKNLHFEDTRQNIFIYGHPSCRSIEACPVSRDALSQNIRIEDASGIRYSKRHIRLGRGISDVLVTKAYADSQFLDGDFAVGFDVENPAWDIEFRNAIAKRNLYSESEYWNGDGFKAENQTMDIRWINCSAFDNADGGFDIKTQNAYLENIMALRNLRNIRIWRSAIMKNINASFSKSLGGSGSEAGIWAKGTADCYDCFLHNNEIQIYTENHSERAVVRMHNSLLSQTSRGSEVIRKEENTSVELIRTTVLKPAKPPFPSETTARHSG